MNVVADSSPLISLATIGSLHLLNQLYGMVYIPQSVWHEVVLEGAGRPGAKEVGEAGWITRPELKDKRAVKNLMAATKLRAGESEAIVLAIKLKAKLIILATNALLVVLRVGNHFSPGCLPWRDPGANP